MPWRIIRHGRRLTPVRWADWLYLTWPKAEFLALLSPGSFMTTLVRREAEPVPEDLQGVASRFAVESRL
jgi:hypothetical protein